MLRMTWLERDRLAASGIPISADDVRMVHGNGIRAILSLTEHPITIFDKVDDQLFKTLDMTYFHVPIPDQFPPTIEQVPRILDFIEQMNADDRPVLVHCHAGIGRTGTILHLYYLSKGHTLDQTIGIIKEKRSQSTLLSIAQKAFVNAYADSRVKPE